MDQFVRVYAMRGGSKSGFHGVGDPGDMSRTAAYLA
jgi:hypothetical protein